MHRQERLKMKSLKAATTLVTALAGWLTPLVVSANIQDPQNQSTALMRGYRTGCSDGYQAGVTDATSNAPRDFRTKTDYEHADRAYNSTFGPVQDYRDG